MEDGYGSPRMPRATFLRVLLLALLGTAVTASLVAHDAADADLAPNRGHDGQQFYAIARAPMHLDDAAEHLDRPRYRLQRPLFPVLAWALHPSGGGTGLVWALIAVGVAGVLLSGLGAGALSTALGGRRLAGVAGTRAARRGPAHPSQPRWPGS